jgi:hypothetical protein
MTTPGFIDSSDFPGDSEERENLALNLKEGLCPEGVISDWGDFNGDYSNTAHDDANVVTETRDEAGVGFSSAEEVQRYYDSPNPFDIDIQIIRRDEE